MKLRYLPRSLRTLGRSVGTRKKLSIARQSLKDSGIREKIFHYLAKDLQHELTQMCGKKFPSVFRSSSAGQLCIYMCYSAYYSVTLVPSVCKSSLSKYMCYYQPIYRALHGPSCVTSCRGEPLHYTCYCKATRTSKHGCTEGANRPFCSD